MNIQDILRGLPFPVQGLLMQAYGATANQKPDQPNAGAGRGFVNPPLVNPNAAPPQMPRVQPTGPVQVPKDEAGSEDVIARIMAGGSTDELQNAPAPAPEAPTPVQAAMAPSPTVSGNGAFLGAFEDMAPTPQGLLSRVGFSDGNQAIGAIGAALAAAGSQDPARTALGIQAQKSEEAKIAEARRRANMPKVDPITNTPFFQVTQPDGTTTVSSNPALAAYYRQQSESKNNAAIEKAVLDDRLARGRDATRADTKAAEDARPVLNDIQGLKGRWQEAREIVSGQGTKAQVQGIPGVSAVAGFFGGDEVAKNKFLEGLTVDETLLNTARTKGAISNQEMTLFKSPIPSLTDDREKVWKPWIEKRLEVLDKLEKFYAGETSRGTSSVGPNPNAPAASAAPTSPASPPPSNQLQSAVTAAGIAWEPDKFQYRIGPNGQVQRKAK